MRAWPGYHTHLCSAVERLEEIRGSKPLLSPKRVFRNSFPLQEHIKKENDEDVHTDIDYVHNAKALKKDLDAI